MLFPLRPVVRLLACAALSVVPGGALAHGVFIAPAPHVHVSFHAAPSRGGLVGGFHGRSSNGYARAGTRTVINGQVVFVGGYGAAEGDAREGGPEAVLDAPVPSDAERYRTATGGSLPSQHGMVVLRPATPRGDVTYLWSSSGGD